MSEKQPVGLDQKVFGIRPDKYDRKESKFSAEDLYWALQGVFEIPGLEDLIDPEKLKKFLQKWEDDPMFKGPLVLYNEHGVPTQLVTEASGRIIHLAWRDRTRATLPPEYVGVEFPRGSFYAAGKVIQVLVDIGRTGGEVDFGTDDHHRPIEARRIENCLEPLSPEENK